MTSPGTVYLVGAGPGDPGLLTLRGLECLQKADLILYDGLANPLLLLHTSAQSERTCRSPSPDGRVLDQAEINQRLIDSAKAGKTVVRLKGGDPFIFGRGGEEVAALAEAGIPYEIVPGITAATAASEYAGISLTHRESASAVAFITGHEDPTKAGSNLDYDVLAKFSGTLVFYMGLHRMESIVERLISAGKDPLTPAAVISRASTPAQRCVTASLAELPVEVRKAELHAPSLIVVGECVRMRDDIAWFEKRPLFGKRIGITRPVAQAGPVIAKCLELGAQPILLPTIDIRPPEDWDAVDAVIDRLSEFDWIVFTSVNGVDGLLGRLWELGRDTRCLSAAKIATIGTSTAAELQRYHLRSDLVPDSFRAEALAEALAPDVAGQRVLWARASRGRDVLPTQLTAAGADVEQVVVYQNVDVENLAESEISAIEAGEIDWIGLSSPSIARSLASLLTPNARSQLGDPVKIASISPVTSAAATDAGFPVNAEATTYTWDGILTAIAAFESGVMI